MYSNDSIVGVICFVAKLIYKYNNKLNHLIVFKLPKITVTISQYVIFEKFENLSCCKGTQSQHFFPCLKYNKDKTWSFVLFCLGLGPKQNIRLYKKRALLGATYTKRMPPFLYIWLSTLTCFIINVNSINLLAYYL